VERATGPYERDESRRCDLVFDWKKKPEPKPGAEDAYSFRDADTVYILDQLSFIGTWKQEGKETEGLEGGYCFGLSAVWSYLQIKGLDLQYDHATKKCAIPPWTATEIQRTYESFGGTEAGKVKGGAKCAGLQIQQDRVLDVAIDEACGGRIFDAITNNQGVFIVALNKTNGSGVHAVAVSSLDGRYHYFDPNRGHFVVDNGRNYSEALTPNLARYRTEAATAAVLYGVKKIKGGIINKIKTWAEALQGQ
jgi:Yersinia/Haemophilus virulence surface antigen